MKPRPREATHHPHHCTVIDPAVATDINALLEARSPCLGNGLELGDQLLHPDFGVLKEDLALPVERYRERLAILVKALGLRLRQIERHPDGEQRRRDHEDDQQHTMKYTM